MKGLLHAIAGVFGFLCVAAFLSATVLSGLLGSPETIALVKTWIFRGVFLLLPALAGAGATGMSMLGERQEPLALIKQQRGPRAFMTTLFVLLPCGWLLSTWAAAGQLGLAYAGVQAVELATQAFCLVMIGLNIRDGLALRGRIARGRRETPIIEARDGGPLVVHQAPRLTGSDGAAHEARPVLALCRCGASKNKPFCDGSHNEIGFDSRPSADRTKDEIL
ncbi:MAG: CDGSH iron-sulfur domain-containing protein, partial [Myxococcota bacterium]